MAWLRSAIEISSYLVWVELHPLERRDGSFKIKDKRCFGNRNVN